MEAFIVVISELVGGVPHIRRVEYKMLPVPGTIAAAQTWLQNEVLPELQGEMPGRVASDFQVNYIQLLGPITF